MYNVMYIYNYDVHNLQYSVGVFMAFTNFCCGQRSVFSVLVHIFL